MKPAAVIRSMLGWSPSARAWLFDQMLQRWPELRNRANTR